jgi:hypothetical protein
MIESSFGEMRTERAVRTLWRIKSVVNEAQVPIHRQESGGSNKVHSKIWLVHYLTAVSKSAIRL